MYSACAPCVSARPARCSTPKRCCSSTTATAAGRTRRRARAARACRRRSTRPPSEPLQAHAPLGGGLARDQLDRDAERLEQRPQRGGMLLGERLRRRHQRALATGLDRTHQRVGRDDRLARADVAEQQPRIGRARRRSRSSSRITRRCPIGERERQRLVVAARAASPGGRQRVCRRRRRRARDGAGAVPSCSSSSSS